MARDIDIGKPKIVGFEVDSVDQGLSVGNRLHIEAEGGVAGSICFHEDLTPDADPTGARLWVDTSHDLYLLEENLTPTTRVQNKIVREDASGAVTLGGTLNISGQVFDAGSGYLEIDTTGKQGLVMDGGITTGGSTPLGRTQHWFSGNFVSDGSGDFAWKQTYGGSLTGAAGDTAELIGSLFDNTIATQTIVDESIGLIAQVEIDEPAITDNLSGTGEITVAAALYVKAAPDEGVSNAAVWVNAGDIKFAGETDSAAVADQVALGGYDVGVNERALAISQECAVAVEVDETKFSHKMPIRINGATYFMMLTAT